MKSNPAFFVASKRMCFSCGRMGPLGKPCAYCGNDEPVMGSVACLFCGSENLADAEACVSCGHSLSGYCPSCRERIRLSWSLCPACGTALVDFNRVVSGLRPQRRSVARLVVLFAVFISLCSYVYAYHVEDLVWWAKVITGEEISRLSIGVDAANYVKLLGEINGYKAEISRLRRNNQILLDEAVVKSNDLSKQIIANLALREEIKRSKPNESEINYLKKTNERLKEELSSTNQRLIKCLNEPKKEDSNTDKRRIGVLERSLAESEADKTRFAEQLLAIDKEKKALEKAVKDLSAKYEHANTNCNFYKLEYDRLIFQLSNRRRIR